MSRLFGGATQNGVVVKDMDEALAYWTGTLGVGPFFRLDNLEHEFYFQGENQLPPPPMSIALGNWGDVQIELIWPRGESASTWHQFLKQRGGGVHHISVWRRDFDEAVALASARGLKVEASGKLQNSARYIYFQADRPDQPLLEISELTDKTAAAFDFIRQVSVDWDGRDPVRTFG